MFPMRVPRQYVGTNYGHGNIILSPFGKDNAAKLTTQSLNHGCINVSLGRSCLVRTGQGVLNDWQLVDARE